MDIVFITEFRFETLIGVYEWERKVPQTIQLDLEIGLPGRRAAQSDAIEDTVDYGAVVRRIRETVADKNFVLLERLAAHVADLIVEEFDAPWVKVTAAKLGIIRGVKKVGVTLERGAGNKE